MKRRKEMLVAALLVAATTVVLYFATRSEPGAPAASTPPREPTPRAAPVAPPEVSPGLSAAASATAPVEVERSVDISAARAAVARPAGNEASERAAPERPAEPVAEAPEPEDELASEPIASADAVANADPVAIDDAGANAESPTTEPVAQMQLAPTTPKPRLPEPKAHALGRFEDRVGTSFSLTRVTCVLDGQTVYSGAGGQSLQLFQRTLSPGTHSVSVIAEYRAHGAGIFSYASGYEFKVSSGRRFNAEPGKPVQVSVIGYEKGGPTVEFADRLALTISTR